MTYNGRFTGEYRFTTSGDKVKAEGLRQFAAKLLGMLVNDAGFNGLEQNIWRKSFPDGTHIKVSKRSAVYAIHVHVPTDKDKSKRDMDMCIGFIVNMTVKTELSFHYVVVHALEPDAKSDEPLKPAEDLYLDSDDAKWVRPIGGINGYSSAYPWVDIQDRQFSYSNSHYSDAEIMEDLKWKGYNQDGMAVRSCKKFGYTYLFDLHFSEYGDDILNQTKNNPPRIIGLLPGAEAAGITQWETGHIRDNEEWRPYFYDSTSPEAEVWNENAKFIDVKVNEIGAEKVDIAKGAGWDLYVNSNDNYLIAARELIEHQKNHYFFNNYRENDQGILSGGYYGKYNFFSYPYSSVALLPKNSELSDKGPYRGDKDPILQVHWFYYSFDGYDETGVSPSLFSQYHLMAENAIKTNTLPYKLAPFDGAPSGSPPANGLTTQETLYPGLYLQPLEYYLDTVAMESQFVFHVGENAIGKPKIKYKAGFYKIHIPSWKYTASLPNIGWSIENGIEYELDIKLICTKGDFNFKLKGITGEKNDKLKILVNTPVEYDAGKEYEILSKILVIDR